MLSEISLIIIGTGFVVWKMTSRPQVAEVGTQTEMGLWIPRTTIYLGSSGTETSSEDAMELDSTSESEASILSLGDLELMNVLSPRAGIIQEYVK